MSIKGIGKAFDVPYGFLEGMPRIEMWGKGCVTVDGYKNIVRYDKDIVILSCKKAGVEIRGFEMEIKALERGYVEIRGEIASVTINSGDKND